MEGANKEFLPDPDTPVSIIAGLFWDAYGRDCNYYSELNYYSYILFDGQNVRIFTLQERGSIIERLEMSTYEGEIIWHLEPVARSGIGITKSFAIHCPEQIDTISKIILENDYNFLGHIFKEMLLGLATQIYEAKSWAQIRETAFHQHLKFVQSKIENK